MPLTDTLRIEWAQQGDVTWEAGWVAQHGHTRTHVPREDEHVGFANYDLRLNGLPEIVRSRDGELGIVFDAVAVSRLPPNAGPLLLHSAAVERLLGVIGRHGFRARKGAS